MALNGLYQLPRNPASQKGHGENAQPKHFLTTHGTCVTRFNLRAALIFIMLSRS